MDRYIGEAPAAVLIVDDHEPNLMAFEAALAPLGLELVRGRSGREALQHLLDREFALIVLDVMMPDMDGFETAEIIRSRDGLKDTPILFVSALSTSDAHALQGYALGAVDYIVKPVAPELLRARVKVFVEWFLHQRAQIEALRKELEAQKRSPWAAERAESQPAAPLPAGAREMLQGRYRRLLSDTLDGAEFTALRAGARKLGGELGKLGAGPAEVMELYFSLTGDIEQKLGPIRARAMRDQCRLLTLEVMGHLADFYRKSSGLLGRGVGANGGEAPS